MDNTWALLQTKLNMYKSHAPMFLELHRYPQSKHLLWNGDFNMMEGFFHLITFFTYMDFGWRELTIMLDESLRWIWSDHHVRW